MLIFQKGTNYSQDGRGNRLVYHLVGCNMSCPWCSNPEGMALSPTTMLKDGLNRQVAREYTVEALLKEAGAMRVMFFDGGGVTLTGGECTLQMSEVKQLLSSLKSNSINTAIETNATHVHLPDLFPLVDELILDFKCIDRDRHLLYTGVDIDRVKDNVALALDTHPDVLIRTPLIGGVNDSADDAERFCDFYTRHDTSHARFELLKYHDYGKVKWEQCGKTYAMSDSAHVDESVRQKYEEIYRAHGLNVVRT